MSTIERLAARFLSGTGTLSAEERREFATITAFLFFSQIFLLAFVSSIYIFLSSEGLQVDDIALLMGTYFLLLRAGRIALAPIAGALHNGPGAAFLVVVVAASLFLVVSDVQRTWMIGVLGLAVSMLNASSRVYFHEWVSARSMTAVDFFSNRAVTTNVATMIGPFVGVWAATAGPAAYAAMLGTCIAAFAIPLILMSRFPLAEPPDLTTTAPSPVVDRTWKSTASIRRLVAYLLGHTAFWMPYAGLMILVPAVFDLKDWSETTFSVLVALNGVAIVLLQKAANEHGFTKRFVTQRSFFPIAAGLMAAAYAGLMTLPLLLASAVFLIAFSLAELVYVPRGEAALNRLKTEGFGNGWLVSAQGAAMGVAELACTWVGLGLVAALLR